MVIEVRFYMKWKENKMIKIILEMWPYGFKDAKRKICEGIIGNDGTGTKTKGNYNVKLLDRANNMMKEGRVENYPRKEKHVWYLVYLALKSIYDKEVVNNEPENNTE